MIKILGRYTSVNVQTVRWCLAELSVDYEQENIGGAYGGNQTDEFLAMNPNGLVPVMVDGDLTMFESAAIVRYLSAKYGNEQFYPTKPEERGPLDMWAEWQRSRFYPILISRIFHTLVRQDPDTWDHEALTKAYSDMAAAATVLDARLSEGPYLAGEAFTYADIIIGALLYRYFHLEFDKIQTPNLLKYYEQLQTRNTFKEHMMVSYESMRWKPA